MGVDKFLAGRCKMSIADIRACAKSPAPTIDQYPSPRDIWYSMHWSDLAKMLSQPFDYSDPGADQALLEAVVANADARFFIIRPKQLAYTLSPPAPPHHTKP